MVTREEEFQADFFHGAVLLLLQFMWLLCIQIDGNVNIFRIKCVFSSFFFFVSEAVVLYGSFFSVSSLIAYFSLSPLDSLKL